METGLGNDVNLDGGVTAGVVDGTSEDLGDGHFERWCDGCVDGVVLEDGLMY